MRINSICLKQTATCLAMALAASALIAGCGIGLNASQAEPATATSEPNAAIADSTPAPTLMPPTPSPIPSTPPSNTAVADSTPAPTPIPSTPAGSFLLPTMVAPTSLEELVFLSDIIARVSLISAEAGFDPIDELIHQAAFAFRFQALEYLKGSGGGELIVKAPVQRLGQSWDQYMSADSEEALGIAEAHFVGRDARWDSREAIVFLKSTSPSEQGASGASSDNSLQFTDIDKNVSNVFRYAISSDKNKAWLPAAKADSATGAADSDKARYFTAEPSQSSGAAGTSASSASSISLADIKDLIAANNALLERNQDVPYFEECVRDRFRFTAVYKTGWYMETRYETEIASGMRPGSAEIWEDIEDGDPYYAPWWIEGPNTHLFTMIKEDPDNDPTTGYKWKVSANRPLPSGKYIINYNGQPWDWVPCDFHPDKGYINEQTLIATAPDGALHEAFFDPASLGASVGANSASGGVGALKPAEFTHNGASVAIEQIEWSPNTNKVALKLSNRSAKLAGHHIDFIELDASVSLRLDIDDAETTSTGYGQTLSWEVCRQPWHPGDQLMLRIAKSATAASVTIKPVCVDDGKPAATATPTAKTTPTHTPTITSDTTATPTYTPTASPTPQQPTATVVPTATPTNTPATAPTATPTPTLTPTPPAGGVSGAIDTPTPTPTSTPPATATHTPTIAPTATETSDGSGDVVTGQ